MIYEEDKRPTYSKVIYDYFNDFFDETKIDAEENPTAIILKGVKDGILYHQQFDLPHLVELSKTDMLYHYLENERRGLFDQHAAHKKNANWI